MFPSQRRLSEQAKICRPARRNARGSLPPGTLPEQTSSQAAVRVLSLTGREIEVLRWLARGKSAFETGVILQISVCTVRLHIQSLKRKLNASNIPHAIAEAYQAGILGCAVSKA